MAETRIKSVPALSLRSNNPYSIGQVFSFDDGNIALDRTPIFYVARPSDRYYKVTQDDTLLDIAYEAYGDSKYWWVIGDTNTIINPFELELGSELIIPDLEVLKSTAYGS